MTGPLPIFPLPSVLFPRAALPLQVFESRYLAMMEEVLAGGRRFGVVLIERGSSVGGGDSRFDVGTVARVVRVGALDEGRLAVVALGEERIRVLDWLPEEPYPRAMVSPLEGSSPTESTPGLLETARRAYRRTLSLASELGGRTADPDPDLPADEASAVWFLCDAAPIEQLDRQRLLEIDDVDRRLERLTALLGDKSELLQARLGRA